MALNLDEIDDFDEFEDVTPQPVESEQEDQTPQDGYYQSEEEAYADDAPSGDVIDRMLRDKGINPDAVRIENDNGEIENKKFSELTDEEKYSVLNYNEIDDDYGLTEDEINLINTLRHNNISRADYENYIARAAVNNFAQANQQQPMTQVSQIPDDELFLIDLKARIPDISDEDAIAELDSARLNEELYQKKVGSIREDYQQRENMMLAEQQQQVQAAQQQQAQQFEGVIVDALNNNSSIDFGDSALSLSADDKNEIASFILDEDPTGVRYIAKALNDPKTLVNMAWYALKGQEAFAQISDYYKSQIKQAANYNYNKGYQDAKAGKTANSAKSVVRRPAAARGKKPLTINDID